MQYIQYEGTNKHSLQLQKYLNDKMEFIAQYYPKIAKHFENPKKIQILDEYNNDKDIGGFWNPMEETVNVVAGNIESRKIALYVLFHEIGHSVRFYRKGVDMEYNSVEQNPAYYRSEIQADSYAARIIEHCFYDWHLAGAIKKLIKRFYGELKEAMVKDKYKPKYRYINLGYGYGNTITMGATSYYSFSGNYNNTTYNGTYYIDFGNSNTTWNAGVTYYA